MWKTNQLVRSSVSKQHWIIIIFLFFFFYFIDWYIYVKKKLKLNQVANLLPLAQKLEVPTEELIDEWRTDKKQLRKILDFRALNKPDETMPQLKAVVENIELAGGKFVCL